jgi:hypothetical protein
VTLPNFLIIGAGRSGTTSLHRALRQHPEVFMSAQKEPHFFTFMEADPPEGDRLARLVRQIAVTKRAGYEALFAAAADAKAIGEASPSYLFTPEVPERIRAAIPGARLVSILRHPVDRAYSAYLGLRRDGLEPAPTFGAAWRDQRRGRRGGWWSAWVLDAGLYHRNLSRYYDRFPPEQMRVHLYDDLVEDPIATIQRLFSFLEVDPTFVPDLSRRYGQTGIIQSPLLRVLWTRSARVRSGPLRHVLPQATRDRIRQRIRRDLVRPHLEPETRAELLDFFEADVVALQDLIGRDLSDWLR